MISSLFLSGRLGEAVGEDMRYVEIERVLAGSSGSYRVDKIPVRCLLGKSTLFFKAKSGSLIILKGRVENDEKIGLHVVDEIDEIFPAQSK
jgi:hypothetical protein